MTEREGGAWDAGRSAQLDEGDDAIEAAAVVDAGPTEILVEDRTHPRRSDRGECLPQLGARLVPTVDDVVAAPAVEVLQVDGHHAPCPQRRPIRLRLTAGAVVDADVSPLPPEDRPLRKIRHAAPAAGAVPARAQRAPHQPGDGHGRGPPVEDQVDGIVRRMPGPHDAPRKRRRVDRHFRAAAVFVPVARSCMHRLSAMTLTPHPLSRRAAEGEETAPPRLWNGRGGRGVRVGTREGDEDCLRMRYPLTGRVSGRDTSGRRMRWSRRSSPSWTSCNARDAPTTCGSPSTPIACSTWNQKRRNW